MVVREGIIRESIGRRREHDTILIVVAFENGSIGMDKSLYSHYVRYILAG